MLDITCQVVQFGRYVFVLELLINHDRFGWENVSSILNAFV